MDEQPLMHIGAPPPPPPPRRTRWVKAVAVAAAGLAVGAVGAVLLLRPWSDPASRASETGHPSPSAARSLANLGTEATCALLLPAARQGVDQITKLIDTPDGSTVDWAKLESTIGELEAVRDVAPPQMHADIDGQLVTLRQVNGLRKGAGGSSTLQLSEFRASGLRIGATCAPYAR